LSLTGGREYLRVLLASTGVVCLAEIESLPSKVKVTFMVTLAVTVEVFVNSVVSHKRAHVYVEAGNVATRWGSSNRTLYQQKKQKLNNEKKIKEFQTFKCISYVIIGQIVFNHGIPN